MHKVVALQYLPGGQWEYIHIRRVVYLRNNTLFYLSIEFNGMRVSSMGRNSHRLMRHCLAISERENWVTYWITKEYAYAVRMNNV